MKEHRNTHSKVILLCLAGIVVNFVFAYIADHTPLPLYLDSIGTIAVAALGGPLPGVMVGLVTNLLKGATYINSIYYGVLHVFIALAAVVFYRKGLTRKLPAYILFVLVLAAIGGGVGSFIYAFFEGVSMEGKFSAPIVFLHETFNMSEYWSQYFGLLFYDVIDKAICVLASDLAIRALPADFRDSLFFTGWKQNPIKEEDIKKLSRYSHSGYPLNLKLMGIVGIASLTTTLVVTVISMVLFRTYSINEHIDMAEGVTQMIAEVIDPEKVDDYIEKGESVPGYTYTREKLYIIRASSPDVMYVYAYKIMEDGCHVVFDLDSPDTPASKPGEVIPFDPSFKQYIPELLNGEKIEPVISNDSYGWLLTIYQPVYNAAGECVCYAAADISMKSLIKYETEFIVKLICLFVGFFVAVMTLGLWLARYHVILPVNSISYATGAFAYNNDTDMDRNVELLEKLDIRTDDEIENLYHAICKTTRDTINYMNDIEKQNKAMSDLQDGLIIVLADMVENRDESTGDHVRKTAAYTKVIMDEMKKKGYYVDQLSDQFMSDVVRAAPLHDIGKINVPDAVLNKPGKLSDDEFEIMKSHTTAGQAVIEQAIATLPNADYLEEAKNLAGYHHEKWNGKGYPHGCAGEEIPLSARIMAVADVFDALVSRRCYKEPFSFEKAMSIIQEDAGTHFDPLVADAFISASEKVREISERFEEMSRTSDGGGTFRNLGKGGMDDL